MGAVMVCIPSMPFLCGTGDRNDVTQQAQRHTNLFGLLEVVRVSIGLNYQKSLALCTHLCCVALVGTELAVV